MLLLDIIGQSVISGILPNHTCCSDWKPVPTIVCLDVLCSQLKNRWTNLLKTANIRPGCRLIFNHIASPVILPLTTCNTNLNPFAVRTVAQSRIASGSGKICGIHRRRDSSLLCLRLGNHIRCVRRAPAGQPVAAGDQQISDVAVMPLMKLTQHSLPQRGPLRASCSAWSTTNTAPPPHTPSCFSPVCF